MYLTELAAVLRDAGLDVTEVKGWKTRGHGGMTRVKTVTIHHTVSGAKTGDMPSLDVLTNGRPGLAGPLVQVGIARSGKVYVIAAGLCYHAGQSRAAAYGNPYAVGLELENDGVGEPYPPVQMTAALTAAAAIARHWKVPVGNVLGHKETCYPAGRKIDPSFDMKSFRAGVERLLELGEPAASRDAPRQAPTLGTLKRMLRLKSPRRMRGEDVRTVQRAARVSDDGVFGPVTDKAVRAFQKHHGLDADGIVGPATAKAMHITWKG